MVQEEEIQEAMLSIVHEVQAMVVVVVMVDKAVLAEQVVKVVKEEILFWLVVLKLLKN